MKTKTAVIDLDGTLATYDKWISEDHFGDPIECAREALMELKEWGWRIVVYTTRGRADLVEAWLSKHKIPFDAVNSNSHNPPGTSQKPIAEVYFDDRDAHVVGQRPYNWVQAMRRVRRMYQPGRTVEIDDASMWSSPLARIGRWLRKIPMGSDCP